jgi:hypothetical protein
VRRNKPDQLRQSLAHETAKIISQEGIRDFHRAKLKASERLGNSQHGSLPSNFEIEQAINAFQKTFAPGQEQKLLIERKIALVVMGWLQDYCPYLVGRVLDGTAGVNAPISIHVACDTVEKIIAVIEAKKIKQKLAERRLKINNEFIFLPTVSFEYENNEIEVLVFDLRQQHQHPKSKIQNRSMQRINIKALAELINNSCSSDVVEDSLSGTQG